MLFSVKLNETFFEQKFSRHLDCHNDRGLQKGIEEADTAINNIAISNALRILKF